MTNPRILHTIGRIMNFTILIRMKTNRAEYIECPIAPVVEQTLTGYTRVEVGKQATRFIVWCSFCGHLAANTAPEQKHHPISFVLEHTPRGHT